MATADVSFGLAGLVVNGSAVGIRSGNPTSTEQVTTSGTSAATTNAAAVDGVATIYSDAAHYAVVGKNPTASATTGWVCPADIPTDIAVAKGEKVALITRT